MEYAYHSPLGRMILTSDGKALTGLWFDGQRHCPDNLTAESTHADLTIFKQAVNWLDTYFSGKVPGFLPPLRLQTTPFRKTVYEILLTIPYGQTMCYGEIAQIIAKQRGIARMSAQAVGGAVGHNPIALIIPCHRVIGTDGSLTGYGGGLDRKTALLNMENQNKTAGSV